MASGGGGRGEKGERRLGLGDRVCSGPRVGIGKTEGFFAKIAKGRTCLCVFRHVDVCRRGAL